MTTLEREARRLWVAWSQSAYALTTTCTCCGRFTYCRGKRRARMLCLDCFDGGAR